MLSHWSHRSIYVEFICFLCVIFLLHKNTSKTIAWANSIATRQPCTYTHIFCIIYFFLSKKFHIKRGSSDELRAHISVFVCLLHKRSTGASTAKAKQAALIWHDLWLPLIISLGVRSWVWLLRTLILNGPSVCSLIITHWAAVDELTEPRDRAQATQI